MNADTGEISRENMEVPADSISESTFLLTELRYTLGQLQAQLSGLNPEAFTTAGPNGQSIQQILDEMEAAEDRYQSEYARLLNIQPEERAVEEGFINESELEEKRDQTVAMLLKAGDNWPQEVMNLAREQVANDRQCTTEIAGIRIALFNQPADPSLEKPLTEQPQPEQPQS